MGEFCVVASPPLQVWRHPPAVQNFWCVQAGVMEYLLYVEGIRP